MRKTNVFKVFVALATIFIGLTFTQCGVSDSDVARLAKEINSVMNCPVEVDQMTRLDSLYAKPGKELCYHYTMFNHTIDDINGMVSKSQFETSIRAMLLSVVNAENKNAAQFRKFKIVLVAEYYDKNGELYTTVRVGPKEYE